MGWGIFEEIEFDFTDAKIWIQCIEDKLFFYLFGTIESVLDVTDGTIELEEED